MELSCLSRQLVGLVATAASRETSKINMRDLIMLTHLFISVLLPHAWLFLVYYSPKLSPLSPLVGVHGGSPVPILW